MDRPRGSQEKGKEIEGSGDGRRSPSPSADNKGSHRNSEEEGYWDVGRATIASSGGRRRASDLLASLSPLVDDTNWSLLQDRHMAKLQGLTAPEDAMRQALKASIQDGPRDQLSLNTKGITEGFKSEELEKAIQESKKNWHAAQSSGESKDSVWASDVEQQIKGAGTSHEQAKSESEPEDYAPSDNDDVVSQPGSDEEI